MRVLELGCADLACFPRVRTRTRALTLYSIERWLGAWEFEISVLRSCTIFSMIELPCE